MVSAYVLRCHTATEAYQISEGDLFVFLLILPPTARRMGWVGGEWEILPLWEKSTPSPPLPPLSLAFLCKHTLDLASSSLILIDLDLSCIHRLYRLESLPTLFT